MQDYIPLPDEATCNQLKVSFSKNETIVPVTLGISFRPNNEVTNQYQQMNKKTKI